jgi:hypothetical protein
MGAITAKDTRVVGAQWDFAPIADIATHPAWARVYEVRHGGRMGLRTRTVRDRHGRECAWVRQTFGEDPYLTSEMVSSIIKGMQGFPADLKNPAKVAACMKVRAVRACPSRPWAPMPGTDGLCVVCVCVCVRGQQHFIG